MINQPDLIMMTIYQGRIDELQAKIAQLKKKQKTAARIIAGAKHKDDYLISKIIDNSQLRAEIFYLKAEIAIMNLDKNSEYKKNQKIEIIITAACLLAAALMLTAVTCAL